MKTAFRFMLVSLLLIGTASLVNAQTPEVTHNTWTAGTAMPTSRRDGQGGVPLRQPV